MLTKQEYAKTRSNNELVESITYWAEQLTYTKGQLKENYLESIKIYLQELQRRIK